MSHSAHHPKNKKKRLGSIDQMRGFAILAMIVANYAADIETLPAWLKHAPDIGLTVIDLVAPLFIYAIGLTYELSARRRIQSDGRSAAYAHFVRRSLALIGIGCLISAGANLLGYSGGWGVLQAIGAAILINLPLIESGLLPRLATGLGLLAGYQFLLERFWLETVLSSSHNGLPGSLGWGAMLMIATVLADLYHGNLQKAASLNRRYQDTIEGKRLYRWACLVALLAGIGLALFIPISKNRLSASYVLVVIGFSGLLHNLFEVLSAHANICLSVLAACGRNPMLLYLFHYLLLALVVLPGIPFWHSRAPLWLVGLQSFALVLALGCLGFILDKKRWYFSL